jgi:acetyl-CoA C-acetyltransferase
MGLARNVAVAGVGITNHGFFARSTWTDLVVEAAYAAMDNAHMKPEEIQAGFISISIPEAIEQENIGPFAADHLGIAPVGFPQIVNACAGGGSATRLATFAVASGVYDRVLVVGVEKISDGMNPADIMGANDDVEYEYPYGYHFMDFMALMQSRYMQKYGASEEFFAQWAVQDRWYANRNAVAIDHTRKPLTREEVLTSPAITLPIRSADCARACDGASALVITSGDVAARYTDRPVWIRGVSLKSAPPNLGRKFDFPGFEGFDAAETITTMAARDEAYVMAGITAQDVDLAQVHDCFPINGIIALEALGIFNYGKGAEAVSRGETAVGGRCPTNTDGGRIGLGHPTGATGINMIVESVIQMRCEAGTRQVPRASVAVCHTMGGTNATIALTVLGTSPTNKEAR